MRKDLAIRSPQSQSAPRPAAQSSADGPTQEQIRARAYEIYHSRCRDGACGDALSDWVAAEMELKGANDRPARQTPGAPAQAVR